MDVYKNIKKRGIDINADSYYISTYKHIFNFTSFNKCTDEDLHDIEDVMIKRNKLLAWKRTIRSPS